MRALKIVGKILLCIVAVAAILLAVLTVAEYRPLETEAVTVSGGGGKPLNAGDEITLMTWNIGYGALGSNADFFMDGGSMVMTADENRVRANFEELIGAAKETGASRDKALLLQHMVLSHHGLAEYGSPKPPMFPEAEVLHTLDTLDARLYQMYEALGRANEGGFSEKVWGLENRQVYRIPDGEVL